MDRDALYREVTEKHGAVLARFVGGYEKDEGRRAQLLRAVHASVLKSLELFDQRTSLRTWVYRAAHNVGTAHLIRNVGTAFGGMPPLDRQVLMLHRESLDAL